MYFVLVCLIDFIWSLGCCSGDVRVFGGVSGFASGPRMQSSGMFRVCDDKVRPMLVTLGMHLHV